MGGYHSRLPFFVSFLGKQKRKEGEVEICKYGLIEKLVLEFISKYILPSYVLLS
jgi:hypothetical protein